MKYICTCGAEYELYETHVSQRDKDSIECEYCKKEIKRWNGSTIWFYKLIKKPTDSSDSEDK